jgi:hypothetical protein
VLTGQYGAEQCQVGGGERFEPGWEEIADYALAWALKPVAGEV